MTRRPFYVAALIATVAVRVPELDAMDGPQRLHATADRAHRSFNSARATRSSWDSNPGPTDSQAAGRFRSLAHHTTIFGSPPKVRPCARPSTRKTVRFPIWYPGPDGVLGPHKGAKTPSGLGLRRCTQSLTLLSTWEDANVVRLASHPAVAAAGQPVAPRTGAPRRVRPDALRADPL